MVEETVKKIHELMAALLKKTIEPKNEEETETEIAEFVKHVAELRTQVIAQVNDLTSKTSAGLYPVESANIQRLLDRLSFYCVSVFLCETQEKG
jgi:hypothetical protein